jgi:hypothetical protein
MNTRNDGKDQWRKRPIRYDAAQHEVRECRRLGLAYMASCPVSFITITADDARRRGNMVEAVALEAAAKAVARAQAVAMVAARRGHVRMKPRPVKVQQ